MKEQKFVIGDRVKANGKQMYVDGDIGTIRCFYEDVIGVEFDNWDRGHSLNCLQGTTCHRGHGWWFKENELELIESAEPRRYTGELKEGMRVMNEMTKSAMIVGTKGNGLTVKYIPDGVANFDIRKTKDGWVINGFNEYISHVISEPEEKPAEEPSYSDAVRKFAEASAQCGNPDFYLGNEEKEEQPRKHWEKCDCFRCLPERFSELYMRTLADGFAVPVPIMAHPNCKISFKNSPHKGGIQTFMDTLRSIPAKIKRILNQNYRAFYQLGWVDEELDLTAQGRIELLDMLLEKHEAELGDLAKKEVARRKKHIGQDEE